jgi:hypothetical protein
MSPEITCSKCLTGMRWDRELSKYAHLISGPCSGHPLCGDGLGAEVEDLLAEAKRMAAGYQTEHFGVRRRERERRELTAYAVGAFARGDAAVARDLMERAGE